MSYTIGEIADAVGLSVHALRFYEREGLFIGPIDRTASGRRRYSHIDLEWLRVCTRLRESQMPLSDMKQFAALVRSGPGNEVQRLALLNTHRARVDNQIQTLIEARDIIAWKTEFYKEKLNTGQAEGLWDPTVP